MKDYFCDLPQHNNPQKNEESKDLPTQVNVNVPTSTSVIVEGVVDITKETMKCFTDYIKCREHEKTERKRIAATLKAIEYRIDANKEVYLKILENNYEERMKLYSILEKSQEKALSEGNLEMLKICYDMILKVYNKPVSLNLDIESIDSF